ncbi:MAG: hypothetical protein ACP5FL_09800, partial [Thermoplasmatota archaeon]
TDMIKKTLFIILIISVTSALLAGTSSYFNDGEQCTSTSVTTGHLDLEINDHNPLDGPVVVVENAAPQGTYYRDVELHLTEQSTPARVEMCINNVRRYPAGRGVVHSYGEDEKQGSIEIARSNGSTTTYNYEAKPTCVKFEGADIQLGEDETVGLTDTFNVTFRNGTVPISGEFKYDGITTPFTITEAGKEAEIVYEDVTIYKIRLVDRLGSRFTFEVESIAKPANTAMSYIQFCFTESTGPCLKNQVELDLSITDPSTDQEHILLPLNEHKNLSELAGKCIWLTSPSKISAFKPSTTYTLNISIHMNGTRQEIMDGEVAFDITFHAMEQMNPYSYQGLTDIETSIGNVIIGNHGDNT